MKDFLAGCEEYKLEELLPIKHFNQQVKERWDIAFEQLQDRMKGLWIYREVAGEEARARFYGLMWQRWLEAKEGLRRVKYLERHLADDNIHLYNFTYGYYVCQLVGGSGLEHRRKSDDFVGMAGVAEVQAMLVEVARELGQVIRASKAFIDALGLYAIVVGDEQARRMKMRKANERLLASLKQINEWEEEQWLGAVEAKGRKDDFKEEEMNKPGVEEILKDDLAKCGKPLQRFIAKWRLRDKNLVKEVHADEDDFKKVEELENRAMSARLQWLGRWYYENMMSGLGRYLVDKMIGGRAKQDERGVV